MQRAIILLSLAVGALGGAVELTSANFKGELSGKNAFVKFLAPW